MSEGLFDEITHAVSFTRSENIVVRRVLLQHHPHAFDIVAGVTPVAFGVQIAKIQTILFSTMNMSDGARDFTRDKGFAATRTFMVEQNTAGSVQPIGFTVIDGDPMGI